MPFIKAYEKAFPNVKIDLVTYDGDANGDWDHAEPKWRCSTGSATVGRTSSSPSRIPTSPRSVTPQLNYRGRLNKVVPKSVHQRVRQGIAGRLLHRYQALCLRNDLAFDVLWYNAS